jgi:hypothetical protein
MIWIPILGIPAIIIHIIGFNHHRNMEKLARLDKQINFLGSLHSRLICSRHMFVEFARLEGFQYPHDFLLFVDAIESKPNSTISRRYRNMMMDVLGPMQLEILDLIADNESLTQPDEEGEIVELLMEYTLFASTYKLIFTRWKQNDFSIHFSDRRFPPDLIDVIHIELLKVKEMQMKLLGIKPPISKLNVYVPAYSAHTEADTDVSRGSVEILSSSMKPKRKYK